MDDIIDGPIGRRSPPGWMMAPPLKAAQPAVVIPPPLPIPDVMPLLEPAAPVPVVRRRAAKAWPGEAPAAGDPTIRRWTVAHWD